MANESKPKGSSKAGETTLNLIGTLAGLAGNLILGPDSIGMDFGAPFKMAASNMQKKREEGDLMKLLSSTPETAPLVEHGPALIQAGGLINNPDILAHPDVQSYVSQFGGGASQPPPQDPQGIPPMPQEAAPAPMPQGPIPLPQASPNGLMSVLQKSTRPAQNDYTSDEFLQKAAALRPDIAEKLLLAKASKDPGTDMKSMLQTVLLGKQIAGFETPEEKRAASMQDRMAMLEATDKLMGQRQTEQKAEAQRLQKEKITPKEEEGFNTIDELRGNYRSIMTDFQSGVKPNLLKNAVSQFLPGGERLMQTVDPQFAAMAKNVATANALFQKSISGAAISEPEARRLRPTQPQAGDNPDVFETVLSNNMKKANELYLIKAMNTANRGGDVNQYIPADQVQLYKAVRAAMNHNLKEALANPRVQAIRQQLGIDYGTDNLK